MFLDAANGVGYLGMKDMAPFLDSTGFKAALMNTEIDVAEKLNHQVLCLIYKNSAGRIMSRLVKRLQSALI